MTTRNEYLTSIETYDIETGSDWAVLQPPEITGRRAPIVSPISSTEFLLYGGFNNGVLKDIFTIDVKRQAVKKVGEGPIGLKTSYNNLAICEGQGVVLASGYDKDDKMAMLRLQYRRNKCEVEILHKDE